MRLNVLSWNSNGESASKRQRLSEVLDYLDSQQGWTADIVFIQEANSGSQGDIHTYLKTCGRFAAADQQPEAGGQGRAYLVAVGHSVTIRQRFAAVALAADQTLIAWAKSVFSPTIAQAFLAELKEFRNLGYLSVVVSDSRGASSIAHLATWHAPRGNSRIGTAPNTLRGGANPDAFLGLEQSGFYFDHLFNLANNDAAMIVGDLNVMRESLGDRITLPDGSYWEVLKSWRGAGYELDSLLGNYAGRGKVVQSFDFSPEGTSDHHLIGGTFEWT